MQKKNSPNLHTICNHFKPPPTGWDQPEKTDAMPSCNIGCI